MERAIKSCFPPVAGPTTRVLVLGSLPGEQSLRLARYYGNPRNHFWRLMERVTGVGLESLDYPDRLEALQAAGVGLWDVIATAARPGSLDGNIRDATANALSDFVAALPKLRAIGFNGGTAARVGMKALGAVSGVALLPLPSSSPAYVAPFEDKAAAWMKLRPFLSPA